MGVPTRVASLSQRMGQLTKESKSGGSFGNFDPAIFDQFWPKKDSPTRIRLIPGEYSHPTQNVNDPFYTYVEHHMKNPHGKGRITAPCTSRIRKEQGKGCVGCTAMESNEGIRRSEKQGFTVLVLTDHHVVQIPSKKDKNKVYEALKPCMGRTCDMCKEKTKKVFGARKWWGVGGNHFNHLGGINDTLGTRCSCGGKISRTGFQCTKGHLLLDIDSSGKTDQEIEIFANSVTKCRKCDIEDLPVEILDCNKDCGRPSRLDIFSVNMSVLTRGENTESTVFMQEWDTDEVPGGLLEKTKPFDFAKLLAPPPAAVVADKFGVENTVGSGGNHTTGYKDGIRDRGEESSAEDSVNYGKSKAEDEDPEED